MSRRVEAAAEERVVLDEALEEHRGRVPCRTLDAPEAWFERESFAVAAAACRRCPILEQRGAYADAAGERWGVWAGVVREGRTRPERAAS
ncbi:WhiB family transcriptional regulator [Janibacter melonis]|uniref:WhiB family transcriptional regulator n=1 Tax=Janibacter melonis TaxID=262209 RepID=UPI0020437BA8|nr:WhiB family transcriptional regulator [Janibacter melonis]MCM3554534.1 WhiB family transcriptional regulator [Janibacter melonis]